MTEPQPTVVSVHVNPAHSFSKPAVTSIQLHEGLGVVGDAHYGVTVRHRSRAAVGPSDPNLRQVHLLQAELFADLAEAGYEVGPGDLGENITTQGLALLDLPVGTRLTIGQAVITVMGLRNPCHQIDDFRDGLSQRLKHTTATGQVVRLAGVMGIVSRSGAVQPGQAIALEMPPEPYYPLAVV